MQKLPFLMKIRKRNLSCLRRLGRGAHHEKTKALIHKRWRQFDSIRRFLPCYVFWYLRFCHCRRQKANYNLAEKIRKAVSNYYAADTKAEEIYSQIRAGNMPDGVKQKGNTYSYTCAIDDKQKLLVEIKKTKKKKFHVVKWEKQYTGEWKPDDTIDVWDGMEQMLPD